MTHVLNKLTPNLIVSDIDRSLAFYRDVLGFAVQMTVPEAAPFVFVALTSGPIEVFLNAQEIAVAEYPAFKGRPIGGTLTLFIEVDGIQDAYDRIQSKVTVVMPLENKWYGMTEFAFLDPDGYVITYAQRT